MEIKESVGYAILLIGGLFALKLAGGVKGITNLFGGLFDDGGGSGGGGGTPQDILTETKVLEEQYESLTPAGQEYAEDILEIKAVETQLEQVPFTDVMPSNPLLAGLGPIGLGINWLTGGETVQQQMETAVDTLEYQAAVEYTEAAARQNKQQKAARQYKPAPEPVVIETPSERVVPSAEEVAAPLLASGTLTGKLIAGRIL